jgi:hypothetical protein
MGGQFPFSPKPIGFLPHGKKDETNIQGPLSVSQQEEKL